MSRARDLIRDILWPVAYMFAIAVVLRVAGAEAWEALSVAFLLGSLLELRMELGTVVVVKRAEIAKPEEGSADA